MKSGEEISARQAVEEIGRVGRRVRRSARRGAVWWLACGAATAAYWSVMHFAAEPYRDGAVAGWFVFTAVSLAYACRPGVYDRGRYRTLRVVAALFAAATFLNVLIGDYVREDGGALPPAVGVIGVLLAAAPPLYAGWTGLAVSRDREGAVGLTR